VSLTSNVLERCGEKILRPGKKKYGQLHEDRPAAWRISSAIISAITKWPEAKKLVDDARDAAAAANDSSDSDDENSSHANGSPNRLVHSSIDSKGQVYGTSYFNRPNLKRKRDYKDKTDEESSDDEEIPDPNPQPSTQIKKARRFSKPKLEPKFEPQSEDDYEVPNPNLKPRRLIKKGGKYNKKAPSKSASREITPTRSRSGELTIKLGVPASKGKGKAPAKETPSKQTGEKRRRSEDDEMGKYSASSLSDPPPSDDEYMEGSEL
jgi:hypothetical protein